MKAALTLAFGLALGCAVSPTAAAETPAGLHIQVYAGLTITGTVGTVYSVDYVTDLTQSNNPAAWRCLEYLQLPASPHLWADKSAPATGKRFYRAVEMEVPTNMVFIPAGTFRMGSPTNEVGHLETESPQTAVTISRGFWMGRYEVTQGEYLALMRNNPSWFNGVPCAGCADYGHDLSRPVERVYWWDATNYCAKLTERERAAGRIASNAMYRLPTEAEWEYACRAWTSTRFSYGDDPGYTNLSDYAWYYRNSNWQTQPVGQKLPNPWGLYDMHGNASEWCLDSFGWSLPGGIVVDPRGPGSGAYRGLWHNAGTCRSAFRSMGAGGPDGVEHFWGFRIVLAPSQP